MWCYQFITVLLVVVVVVVVVVEICADVLPLVILFFTTGRP
jgi:hypothetical protein